MNQLLRKNISSVPYGPLHPRVSGQQHAWVKIMRICFLADSSSIHTRRIVSYYVRAKDEIMILSTASILSDIPGTKTLYLLNGRKADSKPRLTKNRHKLPCVTALKVLVPRFIKAFANRTMRALRLVRKAALCQEEIKRFNADVIYCFRSFPEGLLALCCHVKPLLLRTAGPDISKLPRYPVYRQLIKRVLRTADVVVTESLAERQLLRRLCGDSLTPKVEIIGIDTALFQPPASKEYVRHKYGVPRDAFVVITNRYLEGHYNGWMVVKAMQTVVDQCPNCRLLYVNPSNMGRTTRARAESTTRRYPQIVFVNGPIPHVEMPGILGCGDIYVSFSSFDGVPNSLLEAMGCGLVPVVADLPQLRDWIENGRTGYIVPQGRTDALASIIRDLYNNRQVLPGMSRDCVSRIHEAASYERCSARIRTLLLQLRRTGDGNSIEQPSG